jgi:rSAM/selenodomain-associated transferase 1
MDVLRVQVRAVEDLLLNMKKALIIFQKNPEPGKVKTRLAATIGNDNALKIYNILVEHTHALARDLQVEKFLYFSNFIEEDKAWDGYNKRVQSGDDLGLRMFNALSEVRAEGHDQVVVLGTDCYELNLEILESAFVALESSDYTIGPAEDGGYYLIGTRSADEEVFLGKTWSTESVFEEAKKSIEQLRKSLKVLPILSDVDYEEDLKSLKQFLV